MTQPNEGKSRGKWVAADCSCGRRCRGVGRMEISAPFTAARTYARNRSGAGESVAADGD